MNFVSWLMRRWFGGVGKFNPWRLHCNYVQRLHRSSIEWAGYVFMSIPYFAGSVLYSSLAESTMTQMKERLVFGAIVYALYGIVLYVHVQYIEYQLERQKVWNAIKE
jgi:hypothetical protein